MKQSYWGILALSFGLFSCTSGIEKSNRPAPLGVQEAENWVYNEVLSDEFDGVKLDTAKWYDYNPTWMGRQPSLFRKENVRVENGQLILSGKREEVKDAP